MRVVGLLLLVLLGGCLGEPSGESSSPTSSSRTNALEGGVSPAVNETAPDSIVPLREGSADCEAGFRQRGWTRDAALPLFDSFGSESIEIDQTTLVWGLEVWIVDGGGATLSVMVANSSGESVLELSYPGDGFGQSHTFEWPDEEAYILTWESAGTLEWGFVEWKVVCPDGRDTTQWNFEAFQERPAIACRRVPSMDVVFDWRGDLALAESLDVRLPERGLVAVAFPRAQVQVGVWQASLAAQDGSVEMEFISAAAHAGPVNGPTPKPAPDIIVTLLPRAGDFQFSTTSAGGMQGLAFPLRVIHCE